MNKIKDRLRNYKFLKAKKTELEFRLQELSYSISPSTSNFDDRGGTTNKVSSSTESKAIELAEMKSKLEKLINEHGLEIDRIENALSALKNSERQAIELKYIEDCNLETIIYKMDRQKRSVLRYIGAGLNKIDKILNC